MYVCMRMCVCEGGRGGGRKERVVIAVFSAGWVVYIQIGDIPNDMEQMKFKEVEKRFLKQFHMPVEEKLVNCEYTRAGSIGSVRQCEYTRAGSVGSVSTHELGV